MTDALAIDVISDVVCPWCFIGKRRLERALKRRPNLTTAITWRPFQLDPTIPAGGFDRAGYMAAKFGGAAGFDNAYAPVRAAGAAEGIAFDFDKIVRSPNTRDAHRAIRWAGSAGRQEAMVERLFTLYFIEGGDIGDGATLVKAAKDVGMDAETVARLLDEGADVDLIDREIETVRRMGVTGVPCFIFAGRYAVMGAEPPEALLAAIDRALADREDDEAAESNPAA